MTQHRPTAVALRALGLGDFLTGLPALRALRRGLPEHRLLLAAPAVLEPLLDLAPDSADGLIGVGELEPVPWHGAAPDLAVDLHGNGPPSRRLLQRLEPRRLVGFASPDGSLPGPRWRADEHERARWCRLVEEGLGVPADPDDLALAVPQVPPVVPEAVLVHPGAAYPARRWPVERYAEVAAALSGRGHRVLVTGSAGERALAAEVADRAGLSPDAVLAGSTDLAELAALVAAARLLVNGDTGVAHLASAYRTPSVVLFGPTPPARWGPPETGPHTVLWHGVGPGDPWAQHPDPALLEIGAAEVLEASRRRLRERTTAVCGPGRRVPIDRE